MTLSRTSRILLGILLLAIAAFLWVNYLMGGAGFDLALLRAADSPETEAPAATPVVVAPVEEQVARDLEVLDLPFLVTEPPAEPETAPEAAGEAAAAAAAAGTRRVTVNPFSPILPGGGAAAAAPAETRPQPRVTEVPVPAAPSQADGAQRASAPKAPAPAAVAPGHAATGTLPRALPSGTLGGTPGPLREAIGATEVPVSNLGRMAAVREPTETEAELGEAGPAEMAEGPQPLPEPIAPETTAADRRRIPQDAPLAAGTSSVSRYLRDNNVRFTGSVIGPVSVGVFRTALTSAPVVISLGQTLPDTSIVLTDLRGQQAELTLGDDSQILTLELRR